MNAEELREILESDDKLTIKEVQEIIHKLNQDCSWRICEVARREFSTSDSIDYANDYINDCLDTIRAENERQFYQGEVNAFYICLDLLNKVGD